MLDDSHALEKAMLLAVDQCFHGDGFDESDESLRKIYVKFSEIMNNLDRSTDSGVAECINNWSLSLRDIGAFLYKTEEQGYLVFEGDPETGLLRISVKGREVLAKMAGVDRSDSKVENREADETVPANDCISAVGSEKVEKTTIMVLPIEPRSRRPRQGRFLARIVRAIVLALLRRVHSLRSLLVLHFGKQLVQC